MINQKKKYQVFKFKSSDTLQNLSKSTNNGNTYLLSEAQEKIIKLLKENSRITQQEISEKLHINVTTVARNLKELKEKNVIKRKGSNKNGQWELL